MGWKVADGEEVGGLALPAGREMVGPVPTIAYARPTPLRHTPENADSLLVQWRETESAT